jgi:bacteriocin-like protein
MADIEEITMGALSDEELEQVSGGVSPKQQKTTKESRCRECEAVLPKGWKKPVCENCEKKHLKTSLL